MSEARTETRKRKIAVLGAASGVAEATARLFAAEGAHLALLGRNDGRLATIADDLKLRGAGDVSTHMVDLEAEPDKQAALQTVAERLGGLDGVLIFYGVLGDQEKAETDADELGRILSTNFTSAAAWANASIPHLTASDAKRPFVIAVSSVAGDRGRRSNYAYGAAKGGLAIYMQGLAHKLAATSKARAIVVKLGFVKTSMTAHLDRSGPLWAEPETAAQTIFRAADRGGPIIYAPWFWRWVMLAIRMTPAALFNKVNI